MKFPARFDVKLISLFTREIFPCLMSEYLLMLKTMQFAFVRVLRIHFITVSLLTFCFPRFSHSLSFNITSFNFDTSNILLEGDAKISANQDVELNSLTYFRVGRLTYAQPLLLWDSDKDVVTDFSTRFSFTIADPGTLVADPSNWKANLADGFAFYLAPINFSIPPNSAEFHLGLNNETTQDGSQNSIVWVEFDTCGQKEFDPTDLPGPHVGINWGSLTSLTHASFDIVSNLGNTCHALITYNATTEYLTVNWFFNTSLRNSLSHRIDLKKALPQWITIGFSASTGGSYERHVIHSWEFSSTLNSTNSTTSRRGATENDNTDVVIVSVTCSLSLLIIVALVCWCFIHRKRSKKQDDESQALVESELKAAIPRGYHYQELVVATNGFDSNKKLGQGGSGQVYRGVLNDSGRVVAVKRISTEFGSSKRVFINEVKIISRLIHRNLVPFIGWCHEQGEFLLVFEYMPKGSLDTHLFRHGKVLTWNSRYKIALGVIIAIHYLHEEAEQCVLHRDIKSANVLLDADFNTKLGDFGIAKLVDTRMMTQKTGLVGTLGYLAPEYIKAGRATKETDIYSFGVVILEIACGRRAYQEENYHISLAEWVRQLYKEGDILKADDERLNMNFDVNEMRCLLTVGLWCTHPNDKERPKASQVIKVIQQETSLPELPYEHDAPSHSNPFQETSSSTPPQAISTSFDKVGR